MTAPELLREQMPVVRRIDADLLALGYTQGSSEYHKMFADMMAYYRQFNWPNKTN